MREETECHICQTLKDTDICDFCGEPTCDSCMSEADETQCKRCAAERT
jgi:hypothetical protein